ncbi:hypothetical protein QAD02_011258 [Eretmocerus hayati]|uniref:Uncharacterized protein n=1 Tax=Eretmocerus hayati TaxID=131215 RepID=A0ACC2NWI4_9HYME|nr:hypothetical protein QAD02_011258 [Eretmocerus hayati]
MLEDEEKDRARTQSCQILQTTANNDEINCDSVEKCANGGGATTPTSERQRLVYATLDSLALRRATLPLRLVPLEPDIDWPEIMFVKLELNQILDIFHRLF